MLDDLQLAQVRFAYQFYLGNTFGASRAACVHAEQLIRRMGLVPGEEPYETSQDFKNLATRTLLKRKN